MLARPKSDLHATGGCQEDILRLQVAMDDSLRVRGCQSVGDRSGDSQRLIGRQRRSEFRAKRFAFEQFGDDVLRVALGTDIEDRHDIRMGECRNRARFSPKTRQRCGIAGEM
jgi:hypothetical protein